MMEILQAAASKLKTRFAEIIEQDYISQNYGIKSCLGKNIKSFNSLKLELLFVDNLRYVCLNEKQLQKVKTGNYKNLFKRKAYSGKLQDIDLQDPVVVINNINIVNNVATTGNDEWLTTEF